MLVFFDTNIWIYAFEDHPSFGEPARRFHQTIRDASHRIASTSFVLGELLVLPTRKQNEFAIAAYKRLFAAPGIVMLPYDASATQTYAELRAFGRIKSLDALHLAVAATAKVDLFVTQDANLHPLKVPGIGRIVDLSYPIS